MKVKKEMVEYWVGDKYDDAIKVILEIANSHKDKLPWKPDMLYNDIKQSWLQKRSKKYGRNSLYK